MIFVKPKYEIWEQGEHPDKLMDDIWCHIARCVRVCYQSEGSKNPSESDEDFVRRVILAHKPENSEKNHLAMLEHGTVYLAIPMTTNHSGGSEIHYENNKYSKVNTSKGLCMKDEYGDKCDCWCITTNLRVLVENNWLDDLEYICVPTKYHHLRYTVSFTTNIGVSREFNRHRINSIAEESTRYCNYSKDKFDNSVRFTLPSWLLGEEYLPYIERHQFDALSTYCEEYLNDDSDINPECWCDMDFYLFALTVAEYCYKILIKKGWSAQKAREVLPLATKTQVVHTAFLSDWIHFFKLRSCGISGIPHPNAYILAHPLMNEFIKKDIIKIENLKV